MRYERMSIDEFAEYQRMTGIRTTKYNGIWWAEVRPFFFRSLFPFESINPERQNYPLKSRIGGALHAVPHTAAPNSKVNLFIYDQLQDYSIAQLNEKHRYITRKGIKNFSVDRITNKEQFVREAYEVYVSFHDRTKYSYKDERLEKRCFSEWADALFGFEKVLVLGAYHGTKLHAVDISCHVENVVIDETFFSDTEGLKLKVTDFVLHSIREAAASSNASYMFRGFPSGNRTLDEAKLMRGCKILTLPAKLKINPVVLSFAKIFMRSSYAKLRDVISSPLPEEQVPLKSQPSVKPNPFPCNKAREPQIAATVSASSVEDSTAQVPPPSMLASFSSTIREAHCASIISASDQVLSPDRKHRH